MTRKITSSEDGIALVVAILLMAIMLVVGLATYALVDQQTSESRAQRQRDSSFNLAEGTLYSQGFALARNWPGPTATPYPDSCLFSDDPPIAVADARCPNPATLAGASPGSGASFTNIDQDSGVVWEVKVRDNGGTMTQTYNPAAAQVQQDNGALGKCPGTVNKPCTVDFNDDHALWVNAKATVDGRTRNLVSLMRLEELAEDTPTAAVTSGSLSITEAATGKTIIQGNGGGVYVRCEPEGRRSNGSSCANAEGSQVMPTPPQKTMVGDLMTHEQLMRFRDRAIIDKRYYQGCPTPDPAHGNKIWLGGAVVFVEGCANAPQYTNNVYTEGCTPDPPDLGGTQKLADACINQSGKPGILIWHCGGAQFAGNFTFVGLIYMVNDSDPEYPCSSVPSPPSHPTEIGDGRCHGNNYDPDHDVFFSTGGFGLWGALAIDGPGCLKVKANGFQVFYDANVFAGVKSYGTVGVEQSTWRELPPKS